MSAFSPLHNIVVKDILACSRSHHNFTTALPNVHIQAIIVQTQTNLVNIDCNHFHIQSNFACNLLNH